MKMIDVLFSVVESLIIFFYYKQCFGLKNQNTLTMILSLLVITASDIMITIFQVNWILQTFLFLLINFVLLHVFFEGNLPEKILHVFLLLFVIPFSSVITGLLFGSSLSLTYGEVISIKNMGVYSLRLIVGQLLIFTFLMALVSIKRRHIFNLKNTELSIVALQLLFSVITISIIHLIVNGKQDQYYLYEFIIIAVLIINATMYYMVLSLSKMNQTELKSRQMMALLEHQERYLTDTSDNYIKMRKLKHDISNYIDCALVLLDNMEYDELKKYLEKFSSMETFAIAPQIDTRNTILNTVLNIKISRMNKENINFESIIQDDLLEINEQDLSIILFNLLDNAIEACEKIEGDRNISLEIFKKRNFICITIENSVNHNVLKDNPKLLTDKKDKQNHGIGLLSVNDIVEKNNGIINYHCDDEKFTVRISIPLKK